MGMCRYVGSPTEVRIRREVVDTMEVIERPVRTMRGLDRMKSGSCREGFRLKTSDMDMMFWPPDHEVICDLSQISLYPIPQQSVMILMECEDLPPGYTRLKLMNHSWNDIVMSSCDTIDGEKYISSLSFKARCLDFTRSSNTALRSSIQHGPCSTYTIAGHFDVDRAYCFRSHHWPNVALPWVQRCQLKNWPPESILSGIVKEGCHIVPKGSLPERDEWLISFSGAEQKLIYSLNHCQFLCYGLLKVFLKEIIDVDPNNPSCLCSYFMKTIIFWVVQCDRSLHWVPCNLLSCFWTCFKVLLSWVYKGECPNFFIPQNNMFRVKVVGHTQVSLFEQLYALYNRGILCLLISPTIGRFLNMAIHYPMRTFMTNESSLISDVMLDFCLYKEIYSLYFLCVQNSEEALRSKIALKQLQNSALTSFQRVTTQYIHSELLRNFSCLLSNQANSYDKSLNKMKLAVKIGCVSQILYLAIHYYRNCQYEESLQCLRKAQDNMSKPYVIYGEIVNEEVYRRAMAGMSLSDRMRKCFICDIVLHNRYVYIDELVPEQETNKADSEGALLIPHLVMLHMLFVLNHHRLGDTVRSQQSIQDLHSLLLYDDGTRAPKHLRDISWQILGICQQTCGDYVGALNSFQCSLQQNPPYNSIQKATMFRIRTIHEGLL